MVTMNILESIYGDFISDISHSKNIKPPYFSISVRNLFL